jgi:hypothetical protein
VIPRVSTNPSSQTSLSNNAADAADNPMAAPKLTYPPSDSEHLWSWQKAAPKTSLAAFGTTETALPYSLNLIEAIHWISFPVGFFVAGYVAVNGNELVKLLDGDYVRLYLLVLGHLSQVSWLSPQCRLHCQLGCALAPRFTKT